MFLKKKCWIILFVLCSFLFAPIASAQDVYIDFFDDVDKYPYDYKIWERNGKYQQKVNEVGFKLLNTNKFPRSVNFNVYKVKNYKNAYARYLDGNITVFSSLLEHIDSDDELAAVLAHEIGHIHQLSTGFWPWKRFKMRLMPKHYEHDADCRGVDYMVKAGYNPTAMLTFLNKLTGEHSAFYKTILFFSGIQVWGNFILFVPVDTHPTSSKRLRKVYRHILINYPHYLEEDSDNIYYINFLMNSEDNKKIKELQEKYNISVPANENL